MANAGAYAGGDELLRVTIGLNLGDSYARKTTGKLKRKDLIGIPWEGGVRAA